MPSLSLRWHYPVHLEAIGLKKGPWHLKLEKQTNGMWQSYDNKSENLSSLISVTVMLDLMQNFQYQLALTCIAAWAKYLESIKNYFLV